MATADSTVTTHEELAGQFPATTRPFAVWYNSDPEVDHRKWAVNGEDGEAHADFADVAEALKAAAEMGKEWDAAAKKQVQALDKILGNAGTDGVNAGLPPDILEHFYDLRALAMAASAITRVFDEGSGELDAARRVLSCLEEKALEFANEADNFLLKSEVHHA